MTTNRAKTVRAGARVAPIALLDILTLAGNYRYWGEAGGSFPSAFTGSTVAYQSWVLASQQFHLTRTLQTDTGEIVIQNLSGNTLRRQVSTLFASEEFTGAQAIYRLWDIAQERSRFTFVGKLLEPVVDEQLVHLRMASWFDPNNIDAIPFIYSESCQWYFGSPECGSTSSTACANSIGTCSAVERFCGVLSRITSYTQETIISTSTKRVNRVPRF